LRREILSLGSPAFLSLLGQAVILRSQIEQLADDLTAGGFASRHFSELSSHTPIVPG
jgi:hypothetical protein